MCDEGEGYELLVITTITSTSSSSRDTICNLGKNKTDPILMSLSTLKNDPQQFNESGMFSSVSDSTSMCIPKRTARYIYVCQSLQTENGL